MWSCVREIARCTVTQGDSGQLVRKIVVVILQRSVSDSTLYRYAEADFPSFGPAMGEEEAERLGRWYAEELGD